MSASLTTSLLYVLVAVRTVVTLTCPSLPGCTVVILPSGHLVGVKLSQHNHVTNLKVSRRSVPLSELAQTREVVS